MAKTAHQEECVVGVDIGGTKMMAVVFNRKFEPVGRCRKKARSKKADLPAEERILGVIAEAIKNAGDPIIQGIGAGSPGPLDPSTGVIIDTPNLGWKNFALGKTLADRFEVPVIVDNDVNVGTYGEWCFGDVRNCSHVVGVFPGTGIGGGLIIDGKLFHGFSGAAGEVGHMTIMVDGPYCGCGKRGCLEAVASRIAIAKEAAALAVRGDAPHIARHCGTDIDRIHSRDLAEAIAAGDKMVEDVVRKAAYYVGIAAANLINVLSPEAVVLGGGLVEAMPSIYMKEAKRAIDVHAMPFLRQGVRVVAARLGDDAVVLGGAKLIAEKIQWDSG